MTKNKVNYILMQKKKDKEDTRLGYKDHPT